MLPSIPTAIPARWHLPVAHPVVVESTDPPGLDRATRRRLLRSMLISMGLHAALVVGLGLYFIPAESVDAGGLPLVVQVETDSSAGAQSLDATAALNGGGGLADPGQSMHGQGVSVAARSTTTTPIEVQPPKRDDFVSAKLSAGPSLLDSPEWLDRTVKLQRFATKPEDGLSQAGSAEEAADGLVAKIQGELQHGELLVVWLLDASLSLVDDRHKVAARIESFLEQHKGHDRYSPLVHAVVAFGNRPVELSDISPLSLKVSYALRTMPLDPSGLENVMTAVEWSIYKYRPRRRGNIMMIILTDESGDDTLRLEQTIQLCRQEGVVVHIVGPTAVFGAERGSHLFVDEQTGFRFLVPIKRGPDSSLPERAWLPYWFEQELAPWSLGEITVADSYNTRQYGGMYREKLLSGVGPYALTRLALETGGTFTILDDENNGSPFSLADQMQYLPDYGPADLYMRSLEYHPLRRAVLRAVEITYREQPIFVPPTISFISDRSFYYPFGIVRGGYIRPDIFRRELFTRLGTQREAMAFSFEGMERALAEFGEDGMEESYRLEPSLRWRAWYDLTRGRMLSLSVRMREYLRACELILDTGNYLDPLTNRIVLKSSTKLLVHDTQTMQRRNEAERLLRRCVESNPNTPWQLLAQWELDVPQGIIPEQIAIPEPPPAPATVAPSMPRSPRAFPRIPNF